MKKPRTPLVGHFTRKEFKDAIWNWLDAYADKLEKELLAEAHRRLMNDLKEAQRNRLGKGQG